MTDEERDLLASAYVDGEATPEEVALVERDPDLQARAAAMRAVGGYVGDTPAPPPGLKDQHLAAALAAFDLAHGETAQVEAEVTSGPSDNVVDFGARANQDRNRHQPAAPAQPSRSLPTWLPAAAVFLLIGGGLIAFVSSQSGDDFDAAFDTGSDESADDAAESDGEAGSASDAMESAAVEAMADDDAMAEDDAMEDAMEEEAMEESESLAADGTMDDEAEEESAAQSTTAPRIFPPPVVEILGDLPDLTQLVTDLESELLDPAQSNCANLIDRSAAAEVLGYAPVLVAGSEAELFLVVDETGTESGLLVDVNSCALIE